MMNLRERCCSIILFLFGLLILAVGIAIVAVMPVLTPTLVNQQVPLKENSFAQRTWQDPPFAISMQFWLFNVTNPLEIIHDGAKPALVQKGPYGYSEKQQKKQVVYNDKDNTISYVNEKTYHFEPKLSCPTCYEDDVFIIPNVPYLAALPVIGKMADGIKGLGPLIKVGGEVALMSIGELPFVNVTARALLFDGYDDKIFKMLALVQPGRAPAKMGLFYGRNHTDDGVYVIDSGKGDVSGMGKILTWNGHSDLSFKNWWNSSEANRIMGSDGTVYPPFVKRSDTLYAFISDICRSIYLTYYSDVVFQGINAFRFRLSKDAFDADRPENDGFCWPMKNRIFSENIQPKKDDGWCLPTGMNDISKCQYDSPIVASMPQFMFSPDEVKKSVTGLFPESDDYLSYVDLEPTSGVLLSGARMIQLNVLMQPDPSDLLTKNMKSVIIPLAWVNETVSVDQGTRDYVYQNAVIIRESAYIAGYAAMVFGALWIVCVAVGVAISRHNTKHRRQQFMKLNN